MKITRASEYAIAGLIALAHTKPGESLGIEQIAEGEKVPGKFMAKIMQKLQQQGLVESVRGVKGGFKLKRRPEQISVKEVVETTEGPLALCKCLVLDNYCKRADSCRVVRVWKKAQDAMEEVLAKTTLADIINKNL